MALQEKETRELSLSPHQVRPQTEGSCLQAGKTDLTKTVGGGEAYLVTENGEDVPPCVWSLPAGEVCFPSSPPLVIFSSIFQLLFLSKGKKRQKRWK